MLRRDSISSLLSGGEHRVLGMRWGGVADGAVGAEPGGTGLVGTVVAACGVQRY